MTECDAGREERDSHNDFVVAQFQRSIEIPTRFFEANADLVSRASFAMARRFHRGGRLLVFGNGGSATDAQHVSVEFVHPVIVGKRALPALALTNDVAGVLGLAREHGMNQIYARQLRLLGTPDDIALGLTTDADESVAHGLAAAREIGMLTIGMSGQGSTPESTLKSTSGSTSAADFWFTVPSEDPHVVQETQETAYHILWETVHIFFEHSNLLDA